MTIASRKTTCIVIAISEEQDYVTEWVSAYYSV